MAGFEKIGVLGELERQGGVLLDNEHRDAGLAVDLAQNPEQFFDDQRREAEGRFVEEHQPGPQHQGAADRQHLLLAAGQRAGLLVAALPEAREMAVDPLDIGGDAGAVAPGHRAELQILLDGDAQKRAAPLRYMRDPEPHDVLGRPAGDRFAVETDRAVGPHHAAQRTQHRRLAGAIGAEQGADAAFAQIEGDAAQRLELAVKRIEVPYFKHGRPGASPLCSRTGFSAGAGLITTGAALTAIGCACGCGANLGVASTFTFLSASLLNSAIAYQLLRACELASLSPRHRGV